MNPNSPNILMQGILIFSYYKKNSLIGILLLSSVLCFAQKPLVKSIYTEKKEFRTYKDTLSQVTNTSFVEYDAKKRILKQYLTYFRKNLTEKEPFIYMTDSLEYDPVSNSSVQKLDDKTDYTRSRTEKIRYLDYTDSPQTTKIIQRQRYDYSDLLKEDTFEYDKKNRLVKMCNYSYEGNGYLFCDKINYNHKGQKKRWRMYSKWFTINLAQKSVQKKTKRRDFHYRYNKNGQLTSMWGKYYREHHSVKNKYDANGKLDKKEIIISYIEKYLPEKPKPNTDKTENKKTESKTKKVKQLKKKIVNKQTIKYDAGRPLIDLKKRNEKILTTIQTEYKDTLILRQTHKGLSPDFDDLVDISTEWVYDSENVLEKKIETYMNTKTNTPSHTKEFFFDKKGQLIKETTTAKINNTETSRILYDYNEFGYLLQTTIYGSGRKTTEIKTTYTYH